MTLQEALDWVGSVFGEPAGRMRCDMASGSIAGWDSLGTLMLMAELDEKFGIQLEESELYGLKTVQDILTVLERHGVLAVVA